MVSFIYLFSQILHCVCLVAETSVDTESGLESMKYTDSHSNIINNNPDEGIEVVTTVVTSNSTAPLVHSGREGAVAGVSKIGEFETKPAAVIQDEGGSSNSAATVVSARTARKRRIAGIFQHYYPEGGWGYVIVICGFLSHFLAHGLQFGFLILIPFASRRYQADQLEVGKQFFFKYVLT